MEETRNRLLTLIPFLLAVAVVAAVGGLAAGNAPAQYADLRQPSFAPPSWLFGPVWTVLYLMIGISGWLLWRAGGWSSALVWWVVQLVLNLAWTPLFFAADLLGWALVDILAAAGSLVAGHPRPGLAPVRGSRPCCWCPTSPGSASPPRSTPPSGT